MHDVPREYLDELIRDDVVLRERIADLVRDELADITGRYLPLACDPRMEGVWRELSRHDSNGGFLYPAIGIDQDAAMLELFDTALAVPEAARRPRRRSARPSSSAIVISPRPTS